MLLSPPISVSRSLVCLLLTLTTFASGSSPIGTTAMQELCQRSLWLGAYVPGWAQNDSAKFQSHEFESITYLLHFAVFVRPNGRLDLRSNGLTRSKMRSLVAVGHDSGRKVLLVVGGEGASEGLRIAWNSKNLTRTVRTLINLVEMYGYDGIDLDWEPFPRLDAQLYVEA